MVSLIKVNKSELKGIITVLLISCIVALEMTFQYNLSDVS